MPPSRTLRLAAVQMNSQPGRVADNLQKAPRFVATAAERCASMLPHCAPTPNVSRAFGSRDAATFEEGIRDLAHKACRP